MRLKKGWTLTELAGGYVAVPAGESAQNFYGIVRLNETGRDIWEGLENGLSETDIAKKIVELYDGVDWNQAQKAVKNVVDKLADEGLLEE